MKKPKLSLARIKGKQMNLLLGGVMILSVGIVGFFLAFGGEKKIPVAVSYKSDITTGASRMNPQEVWMAQVRSETEMQNKRLAAMEKSFETILKLQEEQAVTRNRLTESAARSANALGDIGEIQQEVKQAVAEEGRTDNSQGMTGTILPSSPGQNTTAQATGTPSLLVATGEKFRSKGIQRLSISLPQSRANKHLKTIDNYIPAGAFAPAVVLTGVDASTSIQAAGNPKPALLQIMGEAILPGGHKVNLKGCHVTTAATGDLSSERAEVRIERLSCVEQKTGEVIDLGVKGYLAGSDSKAGQRGRLVDRTGPMMRNAAVGGFLSGIAGFFSQNQNPVTFFPSGLAESNKPSTNQLLGQGLSKGASSALDKYADFYIKRAEQMQPIIEITAGQRVAVVFTEGFSLNETVTRQAISKANDQERYHQIQAIETDRKPENFLANTG